MTDPRSAAVAPEGRAIGYLFILLIYFTGGIIYLFIYFISFTAAFIYLFH
jgi:hypothetical protein